MIKVTENAVKQLQEILKDDAGSGRGLRLFIEHGGCAGLQYAMKIDGPVEGDIVVEQDGVRVFIEPESAPLLKDSEVDYVDDLANTGFKIVNPNAARSCGCGTSFEAAEAGKAPEYDPAMDGSVCGDEKET